MAGGLREGSSLSLMPWMDVAMDDACMDCVMMRGLYRGSKMLSGQPFSSFCVFFSGGFRTFGGCRVYKRRAS